MSKLDELIWELCPDGVEFKKLGDISTLNRGLVMSKEYLNANKGDYPVYSSQTENNGLLGKIKTFMFDGEYLTWTTDGANAGTIFYRNEKFSVTNVCGVIKVLDQKVLPKFLYYVLYVKAPKHVNRGMGNPKLMNHKIEKILIPTPPLPVQQEIVRILDNFTLLTAELTAELTARKKQYAYYRDSLLSFNQAKIPYVKLFDIATEMYRGYGIKRDQIRDAGTPCVRYGEIYTRYGIYFDECVSYTDPDLITNKKYIDYGDILFAITGEKIEEIGKSTAYMGKKKALVGGDILVMKHNQNPKYLSYALSTRDSINQKGIGKVKSKVVHTNAESLGEIKIPLPSLDVQQRIVDVLDNFEKICSDLNIGLPAEIEARKKQYEYYRDALLTFAETGDIIFTDREMVR